MVNQQTQKIGFVLKHKEKILYTYSLVVSGIALLFKPSQEIFPEGLHIIILIFYDVMECGTLQRY